MTNEQQILNEREYRGTMTRIGGALLIFLGLISVAQTIYLELDTLLLEILTPKTAYLVSNLLYGAMYLASFMVPVAFFVRFSKGKRREPMRLSLKLTPDTPFLIFGSIGIILAAAFVNSLAMQPLLPPDFDYSEITLPTDYSENYKVVVQLILTALVPGVCEEFLFRGMVLSSLMPYGKTGAIVVSSLFFGLMHQNPFQMFYATVAGVVLALLYIYTGSIWCSTLVHVCNNAFGVFESALSERLPEEYSFVIMFLDMAVFLLAAVSVTVLLVNRKKRFSKPIDFSEGVFEKTLPEAEGYARVPVPSERKMKLFFTPTVIIFLVLTAGSIALTLFMVMMS